MSSWMGQGAHGGSSVRWVDTGCVFQVQLGTQIGGMMDADMGTFRTDVEVENPRQPGERRLLTHAPVDTGAELSWIPRGLLESLGIERRKMWYFRQADGTVLERWTGAVHLYVAGTWTVDEVVFGEPGDLVLLGARSLEGLNLRVEPVSKRLVDAGPAPAAASLGSAWMISTVANDPGGSRTRDLRIKKLKYSLML